MGRISAKALEEFKAICKEEFGMELSDAEALEKGTRLLWLMEIVYRPMKKEDMEEVRTRQAELKGKRAIS